MPIGVYCHKHLIKHNGFGTRLYNIWLGMKARCYNTNRDEYHRYGGRGILVCSEWIFDFVAFRDWALSNGYDDTRTIDRIDNDDNYEPNNCQWINKTVHDCKDAGKTLGKSVIQNNSIPISIGS